METPNLRIIGIGTKESVKLKPKKCKILSVEDKFIEKAKATKAEFSLKHPDNEEPIRISTVIVMREKKGKKEIVSSATWYNLDDDNLLQKDCALSKLLKHYGANNVMEMVEKEVDMELDSDNYLAIKAY